MDKEEEKKEVKNEVLGAIKRGEVNMVPRWQFVLRATLFIIGVVLILLTILYLVSFIVFSLHRNGAWFAPEFGSHGWLIFFRSLPWLLILLSFVFAALLELLVKRYAFAYRKPLIYSFLGMILIFVIAGGFMAPLHRGPSRFAKGNHTPLFESFYRNFEFMRFGDVHHGSISQITPGGFILSDYSGGTSSVVIASSTRMPFGDGFAAGDEVVVFGEESTSGIQAYGIQKVSETDDLPSPAPMTR